MHSTRHAYNVWPHINLYKMNGRLTMNGRYAYHMHTKLRRYEGTMNQIQLYKINRILVFFCRVSAGLLSNINYLGPEYQLPGTGPCALR